MEVICIDENLCTGCRECAEICPSWAIEGEQGKPQTINKDKCVMCGQCVQKCKSYISPAIHGEEAYRRVREERGIPDSVTEPLFAAYNVCHLSEVKAALSDPDKFTMVQSAPAVRMGLAEEFGYPFGTIAAGKLAAALRRIGFDKVYDTNFSADLTIMEEGTELIKRVTEGGVLPMFTSCCPAWVKFLETSYPEMTKHLSSCKSPQQMLGAVFKTYCAKLDNVAPEKIFSVAVMPCTCKEFEANRPEMNASGCRDVDAVLTTRELAWLIRDMGIDFDALPEEAFDSPAGDYTGAGHIFGVTGGVMEAAIRTGYELMTGQPIPNVEVTAVRGTEGFHTSDIKVGDMTLRIGVVTYLKNVIPVLEDIKAGRLKLDFLEVMTCPEGCVTGGGQPKFLMETDKKEAYKKRREGTFEHDRALPIRKSHENPSIQKLYADFLKERNGKLSHKLLHTKYRTK
ncbi:[FeFe] hydrogenase, group A [Sporobacter termitidis DSM 10068]|uniref:[FeFe] hydrogenase, group A n=1 Tax=Sporobacter termitidis DSM 10068 TaxID=1123282 RepID=A0A1M5TYW5_9FIRM|nr:[FeFe] hydrogenase, group A [Sporobacter termitidis]SHH55982.1 [FeFe] hydrogenase, group A [Sporobacter termitidis DSM 10068]